MSAADHLSPQQFFHGSPVPMAVGTKLRPGTAETSPYGREERHVYLTTSATSAHEWGMDALEMRGEEGVQPHVYEVHAPDARHQPHEDDPTQHVASSATVVRRVR